MKKKLSDEQIVRLIDEYWKHSPDRPHLREMFQFLSWYHNQQTLKNIQDDLASFKERANARRRAN